MNKFYRILLLIIALIFLSTYNPNKFQKNIKNETNFLKIKIIAIEDNLLIEKDKLYKKLNKIYGKNILLIKREDIEESLKNIDFLEKIEVKKKYPDTITIKIFETRPVGIIFKDKKKYLLDSSSNLIKEDNEENFSELPAIIGNDAEINFVNFFSKLKNNNFPTKNIKNYYYFKIGRWDVHLLNGQIIKFPTNKTTKVIKQSIDLLKREDFKNYDVIDLRIHGKIVVE